LADSVTAARPRAFSLAAVRSIPAWAWLAGLVVSSILLRYGLGRRNAAPWIMVDELVYSELAKSFAATGHFLWRDEPAGSYGFVYPVLISPAYRAFSSVPQAYAAAKTINAEVMSLAAIPSYLLARRVVSAPFALLGALLAVAVPSMLYTGTMMTENAFYPVFLAAALALVLVLERPTALRQVALLALCGLAFATRVQALALLPALVTAPLLLAWFDRRGWRSLGAYRVLWGALGGAVALVLAVQLARGHSPRAVLGAYEVAGRHHYTVGSVSRWFLYHVAELDLYVGVAPFAALLLVAALARGLPRPAQAFVAAALAVSFWLVLEVAAFASLPTVGRIEERNMFFVAPLFFTALLLWVERGAPRPPVAAGLAAALAVALPPLIPYRTAIGVQATSDTLALLPWWWLQDHVITLGQVWIAVLVGALAVAALLLLVPRQLALVLPAVVLGYLALTFFPVENGRHGLRMASLGALFQGITAGRVDWVDRAAGRNTDVAFLWSGRLDAFTLWENEFFNRSIGPVYELASPLGGGLPSTAVRIDRSDGTLRDPAGRKVRAPFVLTDELVPLAGEPVARDKPKGLVLLRVGGPLRVTTFTSGIYVDTWSGARVRYERLDCEGGRVVVQLASDAKLFHAPQTVTARVGGRVAARTRVLPATPARLVVPLRRGAGGRCRVAFTVSPTSVPARVVPGSTDTRALGVHFLGFAYRRP
jgi:hypothetical protein